MSDRKTESILGESFPRSTRLLTAKDYSKVFSQPLKASTSSFTLLAVPNQLEHARLGLIVAKKNVRFAVQRNRIKRINRDCFRQKRPHLPCYDFVIMARRGSSNLSNELLFEQLEKLWQRASKKCAGS